MSLRFKDIKLLPKLIGFGLVLGLVPMAVVAWLNYGSARDALHDEFIAKLEALRDSRHNEMEDWYAQLHHDVTILAATSDVVEALEQYEDAFMNGGPNGRRYQQVDARFGATLSFFGHEFELANLYLIAEDGDVVYSVEHELDFGENRAPAFPAGCTRDTPPVSESVQSSPDRFFLPSRCGTPAP